MCALDLTWVHVTAAFTCGWIHAPFGSILIHDCAQAGTLPRSASDPVHAARRATSIAAGLRSKASTLTLPPGPSAANAVAAAAYAS